MLVEHAHPPGRFDPGHCRSCARESDLLNHYWQVQRQEEAVTEAHRWARRAHRHASWALWCSGVGDLAGRRRAPRRLIRRRWSPGGGSAHVPELNVNPHKPPSLHLRRDRCTTGSCTG